MKKRKFKKNLLRIMILVIVLTLLSFQFDRINGANDISKLNKITILDKNNEIIYEENNSHQSGYVRLENIDENLISCLLTIEDKNFYRHYGFDIYRIGSVFITNIFNKEKRGASTITQQYVKNLYLSNHKTYIRKLKELELATRLENIYTKDQILEGYLNTIYFSHNLYGIYDASLFYFNKEPKSLDFNEIALLIALVKAPNTYSPILNYDLSMDRKDEILKILAESEIIDKATFNKYYKIPLDIYGKSYRHYPSEVLFYKDLVLGEFYNLNLRLNFNDNYTIYTNYDPKVNESIQNYINTHNYGSDLSCVILDSSGYYISCIGGTDYYDNSFNIALNGNRDIGSTIKPLLYYEALRSGFTPLTTFTSEKTTFYVNNESYKISNFNDTYENTQITMAYALATSDNIYAVKTHLYLGMNKLVDNLQLFNIKSTKTPILALGNVSMSLSKLTSIYNTFSNLGYYYTPRAIKKIVAHDKTVFIDTLKPKKLLNSNVTFVLNDLMTLMFDTNISNNIRVTGATISKELNIKMAGKSGLTDYDSYMIGYNPNFTVGIWAGYNDNTLLTNTLVKALPKHIFVVATNNYEKSSNQNWYNKQPTVSERFVNPTNFGSYKRNIYFL